jgi:hypothetical protein
MQQSQQHMHARTLALQAATGSCRRPSARGSSTASACPTTASSTTCRSGQRTRWLDGPRDGPRRRFEPEGTDSMTTSDNERQAIGCRRLRERAINDRPRDCADLHEPLQRSQHVVGAARRRLGLREGERMGLQQRTAHGLVRRRRALQSRGTAMMGGKDTDRDPRQQTERHRRRRRHRHRHKHRHRHRYRHDTDTDTTQTPRPRPRDRETGDRHKMRSWRRRAPHYRGRQ